MFHGCNIWPLCNPTITKAAYKIVLSLSLILMSFFGEFAIAVLI
jgi:hypothetical protein